MATYNSFDAFGEVIGKLAKELPVKIVGDITYAMAEEGQKIARQSAAADLGADIQHTGKGRGWRVPLDTQLIGPTRKDGATILAPTRSSAGPWTVATIGRNQGSGTGDAFIGPGVNRKTGLTARTKAGNVRKVRSRQLRRWNGYTAGKGTADNATAAMRRRLPPIAERLVLAAIADRLGG